MEYPKKNRINFGIRKTVPVNGDLVWEFLISEPGVRIWLGNVKNDIPPVDEFTTSDGTKGIIKKITPNSKINMTWKPKDWTNESKIQIRVIHKPNRATIGIHQTNLKSMDQRNAAKEHWTTVIKQLNNSICNHYPLIQRNYQL